MTITTQLPSIRPILSHASPHGSGSASSKSNSPVLSNGPLARPLPLPLPLSRPPSVGQAPAEREPLPALDHSQQDPKSGGSITSSEGGPPTPSEFPRVLLPPSSATSTTSAAALVDHHYPSAPPKRRASTTSTGRTPKITLQAIPPYIPKQPTARHPHSSVDHSAQQPTPTSAPPLFPSVFEKPSSSPLVDMDVDEQLSEERRGLGISVSEGHTLSRKRSREGEERQTSSSPKQIKREQSSSPRPVSASSSHSHTSQPNSLDALASAASALSASASSSAQPIIAHGPPSPMVLPLATPSDPQKASQLANALTLRTQQLREIERRRASSGSTSTAGSGMGGLTGALDKLSGRANAAAASSLAGPSSSTVNSPPSSTSVPLNPSTSDGGKEGSGLAKRRGNIAREKTKNLTVLTPSYGPSSSGGVEAGLKSAPAKAPASRMAPGVTPSVLVGPSIRNGGMVTARPDFAEMDYGAQESSRGNSSRTVVLPAAGTKGDKDGRGGRGQASAASTNPPMTARRDPYPSVTQPVQTPRDQQPPPPTQGSSFHPREREAHQVHHHSRSVGGQSRIDIQAPHTASHPHFPPGHPLHQPSGSRSGSNASFNPSPTSRRASPPLPPPQHSPLPPLNTSNSSTSSTSSQQPSSTSSKSAFLSLFATFYDSLSDSRVLANTLEDQIRRSSSLLHTLHESGKFFEDMLEKRVKEAVEDMTRDMLLSEGRIVRLEKMVGVPHAGKEVEGGMGDRLDRLERMVEKLVEERTERPSSSSGNQEK